MDAGRIETWAAVDLVDDVAPEDRRFGQPGSPTRVLAARDVTPERAGETAGSPEAAAERTVSSSLPCSGRTSTTRGSPNVTVPVLSSTTVSTAPRASRYSPPFTMEPMRAARPIAPRIASGVPAAIPHAPATMITEIVDRASRVTRNVNAALASAK